MSHDISVSVIRDVDTNNINIKDFIPADYFPSGYTIRHYRDRRKNDLDHSSQHKLLGKNAPGWTLFDTDSIQHSLRSYASKVLLIEFTSISCGPCISAIPFLNQLKNDYNRNELDFVSIEAFNNNLNAIKKYEKRNRLEYKLLLSTEEINKKYYIHSTPVFFILDEKRIIKRVFRGYKKGLTDEKMKNVINKMIK
jgi:thiol-disulfide isomerase/thioredoxin